MGGCGRLLGLAAAVVGLVGVAIAFLVGGLRRLLRRPPRQGTFERPIDVYRRRREEARRPQELALRRSEEQGYELRDASWRAVVVTGMGIVAASFLITVLLAWMFRYLAGGSGAKTTNISNIRAPKHGLAVMITPQSLPPYPRLMVNEPGDLHSVKAAWQRRLSSYGWVDRRAGVVHIPIERAMDILAGRGPRPATTPTPTPEGPTEWNNGRSQTGEGKAP